MADDLEFQRRRRAEATELSLARPNCARCLTAMEPRAFDVGEAWVCPSCGEALRP